MKTLRTVSSTIVRHALLAAALVPLLVLGYTATTVSGDMTAAPKRTVRFNHAYHVKEAGVACADCHTAAAASTSASDNLFAQHPACQSCHEEQLSTNCSYCHLGPDSTKYTATPNPRRELRFSHKSHVADQKVACETCHGEVDDAAPVPGKSVPSMAVCSTCHNDVKATNACETCHTNLAALRPRDHNATDYAHEHKFEARLSDAKCGACHTQESCSDCHNGSALTAVDVPGRDLMSGHSPRLAAIDRGQGMTLMKVHDLNFRYTHGIAAKGKTAECRTCHSEETFCADCHNAGGNVNQSSFKPVSHSDPMFLPPIPNAVGSGGGTHAKLARKDIESCAACHNIEGADPTCVQCHSDADGIKGTDPRTHERGFMSDTHGDWHTDPGSTCFVCHTDPSARTKSKGHGFCGYCHK